VTRRLGPGDDDILRALETAYERPIPAGGEILADERAHVLAAFEGDEPVGYALLYVLPRIDGRSMVFLYDVGVAEPFRRRGVGRKLMEAATAAMREAGAYKMFVLTDDDNEAAMALYASAGASREGDQVLWTWAG
jgi:ribosomal protein S18 acetylase RimI-like enzyme